MIRCPVGQSGSVELLFYGELDGAAALELRAHLAGCAECRRVLEDLQVIQAALATRPDVCAPAGGDWTEFMARLSDTVARETRHAAASVVPVGRLSRPPTVSGFVGYLAMAALLALVTLSVAWLGHARFTARDARIVPTLPGATDRQPGGPSAVDAAFASLSEQHFERSKLVVLGLLHKDAATAPDWAYERQLAAALLSDTRLYRQAAEERGLTKLARIMDDLELVLLQTSVVEEPEPETLQQIQRLIAKRDLITKMNAVTTIAGM